MDRVSKFEAYKEKRFDQLTNAMGSGIELTDSEAKSLMWIAGCEPSIVDNLSSIFIKLRNDKK